MADLPDWLIALLGGQQGAPAPAGPAAPTGLLGGFDPSTSPLLMGRSAAATPDVPQVADETAQPPTAAPVSLAPPQPPAGPTSNVIGTPNSGAPETPSPLGGINNVLGNIGNAIGGIYGAGGPGDALIALGLSNRTGGKSIEALNAAGNQRLNAAKLAAFNLQLAQQTQGQNATFNYLKSKGLDDAAAQAAMLNPDLASKYFAQYAGGNKSQFITNPTDNSVIAVNPYDVTDKAVVVPPSPGKPFVMQEDQYGRKVYGTMKDGVATPLPNQGPLQGEGGTPSAGLQGEDYLKTLPPALAGQVKGIAEGRVPYPTGQVLRTPYGQQLTEAINQYAPDVDAGVAQSRFATRKAFTSGGPNSPAAVINTGNTAIGHLGKLSDTGEEILKEASNYPTVNAFFNALAQQRGGAAKIVEFNNALGKYVEEATKFYRGTGGTESDIQRDIANLNPNQSPAQMRAAIHTQAELMRSKIDSLQEQWHKGMGENVPDFQIVGPRSQDVLDRIQKRYDQGQETSKPALLPPPPVGTIHGDKIFVGGDPSKEENWKPMPSPRRVM